MRYILILTTLIITLTASAQKDTLTKEEFTTPLLSMQDLREVTVSLGKMSHDEWTKVVAALDKVYYRKLSQYRQAKATQPPPGTKEPETKTEVNLHDNKKK